MLVPGVKMFNTGFLARNKMASHPMKNINFTGGGDTFVRSKTTDGAQNSMADTLSANEKRYLGENVKYLDEDRKSVV